MSVFSTNKAIIVAGAKHGSTQLQYTAYQSLGIPYYSGSNRSESMPYVKQFAFRDLYSFMDQGIEGENLLKALNFPLTNTFFNRVNFAYDLSNYKGKPLMLIVRDPLKAANAAIIEDLLAFINAYSGILASTVPEVSDFFRQSKSPKINKYTLSNFKNVQTLMFKLNEQALELQYKLGLDSNDIFPHTEHRHLSYISNILDFFTLRNNQPVLDNTFIVDLDKNKDIETKRTLHHDRILVNDTPHSQAHTTVPLLTKLPLFLNEIANNNIIYKKRLKLETTLYEYIQTQYVENLFSLNKYTSCQEIHTRNCLQPSNIEKVKPIDEVLSRLSII